jgi:nucleoside-triphosphatase
MGGGSRWGSCRRRPHPLSRVVVVDITRKKRHVLITGLPGTGKTTLIASLVKKLPGTKAGFITREVREGGTRTGFEIETLDGATAKLADTFPTGRPRVGKYRVLVKDIDEVAVPAIRKGADFIVVDEIGKMECASSEFVRAIELILGGPGMVIATIAKRGTPFIEAIKGRPDVVIYEVTRENRNALVDVIAAAVSTAGGGVC